MFAKFILLIGLLCMPMLAGCSSNWDNNPTINSRGGIDSGITSRYYKDPALCPSGQELRIQSTSKDQVVVYARAQGMSTLNVSRELINNGPLLDQWVEQGCKLAAIAQKQGHGMQCFLKGGLNVSCIQEKPADNGFKPTFTMLPEENVHYDYSAVTPAPAAPKQVTPPAPRPAEKPFSQEDMRKIKEKGKEKLKKKPIIAPETLDQA